MVFSLIDQSINPVIRYFSSGVCLLCQSATHRPLDLCLECEDDMPTLINACVQCASPLPQSTKNKQYCGACLLSPLKPYRVFSPFIYKPPIDRLIAQLKFKHHLTVATVLGQLMVNKLQKIYQSEGNYPSLMIPIPLHAERLKERGFNQALELARVINRKIPIPLDYQNCIRIKKTLSQTGLSANERAKNIKNAFILKKPLNTAHICLIDDVLTTGHTAFSLSEILLKNGAKHIDIWSCARASLKD